MFKFIAKVKQNGTNRNFTLCCSSFVLLMVKNLSKENVDGKEINTRGKMEHLKAFPGKFQFF